MKDYIVPNTCDLIGVSFLYPESWEINGPVTDDDCDSFVLESPQGMFFSINRYKSCSEYSSILSQAVAAMREEYPDVEEAEYESENANAEEQSIELQFECNYLIVTSRLLAIRDYDDTLLIQCQAENRDFDENELVFEAMMKSLRDSLNA